LSRELKGFKSLVYINSTIRPSDFRVV